MRKILALLAGLALLVLFGGAVSAQTDAPAADEAPAEPSAYVSVDFQQGFVLDPFLVSVNGGGEVDSSTLDESCVGWINDKPVVSVNWQGEVEQATIFFFSDHDSTLTIELPDGSYLCNDDAGESVLDASITMTNPMTGTYSIFVGTFEEQQLIPGLLVITARDDMSLGTFAPGELVKRESLPADEVVPLPDESAAAMQAPVEAALSPDVVIEDGSAPVTVELTVEGELPAFRLEPEDVADVVCSGLVNEGPPDFLFEYTGSADNLRVFFEGDGDATLVVAGENVFYCNDDQEAGVNANPRIDIAAPAGFYGVWVGRIDPDSPLTGTLTVAAGQDAEPEQLGIPTPETTPATQP
jgi:hypothetical protein